MDTTQKTLNNKIYIIAAVILLAVLAYVSYTYNHKINEAKLTANQKIINEYLSKNIETQKVISASMEMVSDYYSKKTDYPLDKIKAQYDSLVSCKNTIETDSGLLQPIKKIYTDEYNTVESLLVFTQSNYGTSLTKDDINFINNLGNKEKEICVQKNNAYMELFKSANLNYTVSADGTINYEYHE